MRQAQFKITHKKRRHLKAISPINQYVIHIRLSELLSVCSLKTYLYSEKPRTVVLVLYLDLNDSNLT